MLRLVSLTPKHSNVFLSTYFRSNRGYNRHSYCTIDLSGDTRLSKKRVVRQLHTSINRLVEISSRQYSLDFQLSLFQSSRTIHHVVQQYLSMHLQSDWCIDSIGRIYPHSDTSQCRQSVKKRGEDNHHSRYEYMLLNQYFNFRALICFTFFPLSFVVCVRFFFGFTNSSLK